jgi:hypothetical protein
MADPDKWAQSLLDSGYTEVDEIRIWKVSDRVRHSGEQYSKAYDNGTSTIERIFTRGESDIEIIIHRGEPRWSPTDTHSQWANYHTIPVRPIQL